MFVANLKRLQQLCIHIGRYNVNDVLETCFRDDFVNEVLGKRKFMVLLSNFNDGREERDLYVNGFRKEYVERYGSHFTYYYKPPADVIWGRQIC